MDCIVCVTFILFDFSIHQDYEGPNDIEIGDGSGLSITHVGHIFLSNNFSLSNVLRVPFMKKNLISIFKFHKTS